MDMYNNFRLKKGESFRQRGWGERDGEDGTPQKEGSLSLNVRMEERATGRNLNFFLRTRRVLKDF